MAPLRFLAPDEAVGDLPVIFIPGWACTGHVLDLLEEKPAWYSPADFIDPATFQADFLAGLDSLSMQRVILVGWSMGAYLALDFARDYPERVHALALLSVRKNWPAGEIAQKKAEFAADAEATLKDFYRKCFLGYRGAYGRFQERLLSAYLSEMPLPVLAAGLTYLAGVKAECPLPCPRSRCFHGEKDIIAPVTERGFISAEHAEVLAREGHALFLGRGLVDVQRFLAHQQSM